MNEDRIVLITGASRGIGRSLVEHFARRGFRVVGCSRTQVHDTPPAYQHFCVDVSDEDGVKAMVTEIRKNYGRLDVLVNNAGIASMNHILLTPITSAREILEVNVTGTFLLCREAAKLMQRRGTGRIVNFASVATPLKLEGEAIYAASKAAVVSLTQILARELADFGITVNAVGPTPVKTQLIRSVPEEKIRHLVEQQAISRLGEFSDISNVIDFFIQPGSNFITGQVLYLGGV